MFLSFPCSNILQFLSMKRMILSYCNSNFCTNTPLRHTGVEHRNFYYCNLFPFFSLLFLFHLNIFLYLVFQAFYYFAVNFNLRLISFIFCCHRFCVIGTVISAQILLYVTLVVNIETLIF